MKVHTENDISIDELSITGGQDNALEIKKARDSPNVMPITPPVILIRIASFKN